MKKILIALAFLSVAGCDGGDPSKTVMTSEGRGVRLTTADSNLCLDGVVYVRLGTHGYSAKFDRDSKVVTCGQPVMVQ
jgi:hypothetical protein